MVICLRLCMFSYFLCRCILIRTLISGALLLEEVINSCGAEGIDAILESAEKRINESQQEKTAGSIVWWRVSGKTLF